MRWVILTNYCRNFHHMYKDLNFFLTSNYGGGGQTVPRLFAYINILKEEFSEEIKILLNYRYLNFREIKPIFNSDEINHFIKNKITLNNFLNFVQKNDLKQNNKYRILLDSGIGNILGYWINKKKYDYDKVKSQAINLVDEYLEFIKIHKPDIFIALDYCKKNTYKQKETENPQYNYLINKLIKESKNQNSLLKKTLAKTKGKDFKNIKIFAPVHGNNSQEYLNHYIQIINIEKEAEKKFDGFALGGLSNFRAESEIGKIIKLFRESNETRPIHVLGSSGIKKLFTLIFAGANSFDCHTPWRRANDGKAKILVPLLDKNLKLIQNTEDVLKYVDLISCDQDCIKCSCPVCEKFPIDKIKTLYLNKDNNPEDYYFSSILLYFHAIFQYEYILKKLKTFDNKNQIYNLIEKTFDEKFRKSILKEMDKLI